MSAKRVLCEPTPTKAAKRIQAARAEAGRLEAPPAGPTVAEREAETKRRDLAVAACREETEAAAAETLSTDEAIETPIRPHEQDLNLVLGAKLLALNAFPLTQASGLVDELVRLASLGGKAKPHTFRFPPVGPADTAARVEWVLDHCQMRAAPRKWDAPGGALAYLRASQFFHDSRSEVTVKKVWAHFVGRKAMSFAEAEEFGRLTRGAFWREQATSFVLGEVGIEGQGLPPSLLGWCGRLADEAGHPTSTYSGYLLRAAPHHPGGVPQAERVLRCMNVIRGDYAGLKGFLETYCARLPA